MAEIAEKVGKMNINRINRKDEQQDRKKQEAKRLRPNKAIWSRLSSEAVVAKIHK